ncbi:MAG: tellurite resistance protein TerC [Solirubrobacteraceae bacterium]|jgi:tellurite resistance protein TerC|nr:tellurite resistance protein TerC [Solirubrobacteraceae bacterium]
MLPWLALGAFVLIALAIDLRADNHKAPSMRSALLWSVLWTGIGVSFAGVLLLTGAGSTAAEEYLAGFLIEKSLSLDNLFVFAVLFSFFAVPVAERHRVLLLGVAGAIVLRTIFIVAGAAALDAFHFMTYILGALLAVTAIKIARHDSTDIDPDKNVAMRLLRRFMPVSDEYDGSKLTTTVGGRRAATPLAAAFVMVAAFDVMFAIDSIPAIFAITRDTFIVFAANAFSLLGMISLYFLLDGMLERFRHLHFGLAAILGWVAAKLILVDVWHPPITLTLAVVAGALAVAAVTSVIADRRERAAAWKGGAEPAAAESD